MAGVSQQPGGRQSNSHIVALLSLKILLLAFFILLNALASFEEERRDAVLDSVRQAFEGVLPAQGNLSSSPAALDVFEGADRVIESLKNLFGDDLPIVERRDNPNSWTLQVDFPASDLFAGDGRELAPEGAETLRIIGAVLEDPRFADLGYRVDLLYGVRGRSSGIDGHRAAMSRAGALVRELDRQGLEASRISTGLLPSFAERVRIYFTIDLEAPADAAQGAQ
jgi:hypothetical protein